MWGQAERRKGALCFSQPLANISKSGQCLIGAKAARTRPPDSLSHLWRRAENFYQPLVSVLERKCLPLTRFPLRLGKMQPSRYKNNFTPSDNIIYFNVVCFENRIARVLGACQMSVKIPWPNSTWSRLEFWSQSSLYSLSPCAGESSHFYSPLQVLFYTGCRMVMQLFLRYTNVKPDKWAREDFLHFRIILHCFVTLNLSQQYLFTSSSFKVTCVSYQQNITSKDDF